jgi:hypothetical protein
LWYSQLLDQGIRLLYDNLWEPGTTPFTKVPGMVLNNPNWFWYNESLWYRYLGYDQYQPDKTYSQLAFMPMRLRKSHRDQLIQAVEPYLDRMIYSYVEQGISLPNDLEHDLITLSGNFQRHFDPAWYDDTYFSIVAETSATSDLDHRSCLLITEKTFKPIAFNHPFIIWGEPGSLQRLTELGFVTYNNLFDESYDQNADLATRLQQLVDNVANFKSQPYDSETLDRISHNRNHFYNQDIVNSRIITEVIEPIVEYASQ